MCDLQRAFRLLADGLPPLAMHVPGPHYQQEVDLLPLFKDVASEYIQVVTMPKLQGIKGSPRRID